MRIPLPDFEMAYTDHGAGRPLLLIHGFPLNRQLWEPQVAGLGAVARVLAPDLRGHGESEVPAGPYTMDRLADDCAALLDSLGVQQPVVVCGLSMGGYVALAFYRKYVERLAGLILTATRAVPDTPEGKTSRDKMAALAEEQGARAVAKAILPVLLAPQTYSAQPELVARVQRILESAPVAGIVGALAGMRDRPDASVTLAQIQHPTLIVHGAADQLIPVREAEAMHAAIAHAQLHLLPEAGHLLNLEQPETFNAAVRAFLQSL